MMQERPSEASGFSQVSQVVSWKNFAQRKDNQVSVSEYSPCSYVYEHIYEEGETRATIVNLLFCLRKLRHKEKSLVHGDVFSKW